VSSPSLNAARTDAYTRQAAAVRARVQSFASARFTASGAYRDADLARFVNQVSPIVLAGRRQTAALTDAYLSQVMRSAGIKIPVHKPVDTAALRGVDVTDVYARPYQTVWTKLSDGLAFEDAVSAGASRLADLIGTDMQMARTYTSQNVLSRSSASGYERVPSGMNTCALCEIASTQMYHIAELMPIHPGCACGVEPVTDSNPWDQGAADQRLEDTHAAVFDRLGVADSGGRDVGLGKVDSSGNSISDYTALVAVRDHGEIGPMLVRAGDHFTGPGAIK
jgi:hypothetical protein